MTDGEHRDSPAEFQSRKDFGDALTRRAKRLHLTQGAIVRASKKSGEELASGTLANWMVGNSVPSVNLFGQLRTLLLILQVPESELEDWVHAARWIGETPKLGLALDSPWPGLESFAPEQAEDFYGRDEVQERLQEVVRETMDDTASGMVVVSGASGAGKTSLFNTVLRTGQTPCIQFAPGADPQVALESALARRDSSAGQLIVIVDQFEELWTQTPRTDGADRERRRRSTATQQRFLRELSAWAREPATAVVVGLRADYYQNAVAEPVLHAAITRAHIPLAPMTWEQLRQVIVEPAAGQGREFVVDPPLLKRLREDLEIGEGTADPGILPLLSHVLRATWEMVDWSKVTRTARRLTYEHYERTGGVRHAVARSADEVYDQLTADQRRLTRRLMTRAVVLGEQSVARRRVALSELDWADTTEAEIDNILERFAERRLITLTATGYEVSHEALLTAWPTLAKWIEDNRATILRHRRLGDEAEEWDNRGRPDSHLLTPGRTEEFAQWAGRDDISADLNTLERAFVAASVAHLGRQREREHAQLEREREQTTLLRAQSKRLRRGVRVRNNLLAVALVAILVAAAALVGFGLKNNELNTTNAQAWSRQAALQFRLLRDRDPALAQQLALAAYGIAPTVEARSALLDSTATATPTRTPTSPGPISTAISGDATLLAVVNNDGKVRICAPRQPGHPVLATFDAAPEKLYAAAFRPGRPTQLAVGGAHGASLWDLTDIHAAKRLATLPGNLDHLSWSPDGSELAASTDSGTARWAVDAAGTTTTAVAPLSADTTATHAVAYSPDGALLATGGENAAVQLWSRATPAPTLLGTYPMRSPTHRVLDVAFDPGSKKLAIGSRANEITVLDITDPANPRDVQHHTGFTSYVNAVTFSPDASVVAGASSDNKIRLFHLDAAAEPTTLAGPTAVTSVRFLDQATLISASTDGFVNHWSLPGPITPKLGGRIFTLPADTAGRTALVGLAPDRDPAGKIIDVANVLRHFDITDPARIHERGPAMKPDHTDSLSGVAAVSDDGTTAAAGTSNGTIYVWDIRDSTPQRIGTPIIGATDGLVVAVAFSPDAGYLFAASSDSNHVSVIDRKDPQRPSVARQLDNGDLVQLLSVSGDGQLLAVATATGVSIWDLSRGTDAIHQIAHLEGFRDSVAVVEFSGRLLAAGSQDKSIRLWDLSDPSAIRDFGSITGPAGAVYSLTINAQATRMAAGIGNDQIWVWDITDPARPSEFAVLYGYPSRVNDIAYGSEGASFTAAGPDQTLRTWHTDPATLAEELCTRTAALLTADEWIQLLPGIPHTRTCPR